MKYSTEVNLQEAGVIYFIDNTDISDLSDEAKEALFSDFGVDEDILEESVIALSAADVEKYGLVPHFLTDTEWNDDAFNDVMDKYIKESDHYLVFASGCRWNGASGYRIANSKAEIVSRGYDAIITPVAGSRHRKVLVCRESSHDVPTGARTIVVALSQAEYEKLQYADFADVKAYAETMAERAA